jgi:DNA-binding transcriptional regulator YiaG
MTHPVWKRSYAEKAIRLRRRLADKALAEKLGVHVNTLSRWGRKLGRK